ncbi:DNA-directed RNA polymerase, mitochondrial [Choanephora cucurbitarum]|uniref:DNA-directed RNA polymerase n=1 Tax=Choanephora cucurbitarum TaxID=101091 RepID=A0A1C7NPV9_9FUNG|nr:DNA-directed RNA polymerase, mitochondrial [Choanephora cucurbitarum]
MSLSLVRQTATKGRLFPIHRYQRQTLLKCASIAIRYNSSSATVEASSSSAAESKPLNNRRQHIIFPSPALDNFTETTRVLPSSIAEQFAILKACIASGSMERAERIMTELYKTKPKEMKMFADINVYNSFLNGFVEAPDKPMTKNCLSWFDHMKAYGVNADADTFAIIVKGFLKVKSYHTARALLRDLSETENITVDQMLRSQYLSKDDVHLFRQMVDILKTGGHDVNMEQLLNELENRTDNILGKPAAKEVLSKTRLAIDTAKNDVKVEVVPEVKPTKSIGVHFLQEQLAALRDPHASAKMDPFELQLALEQQGYEMALQKLLHSKEQSIERGDTLNAMNLTPLKRIMWTWHQSMMPLIKEEIERCDAATLREADRRAYGPFLKLLPPQTLSIVTILELLRLHNSSGIGDGMKTARAIIDIGKAVEMEYNAVQIKRRASSSSILDRNTDPQALFSNARLFNLAVRKAQSKIEQNALNKEVDILASDWNPVWPSTIRAKVGSVLTSLLLEAAKIPVPSKDPETGMKIIENIPAFFHTYQYVHGKRVGIIKFSEQLTRMLSREPVRDTLHPRLLPMLVHPRPWLSYNSGGYLSTKSVCMRIKDSAEQLVYLSKASEQDHLTQVLAGLDVLGSTRWRVNKDVFKVILDVWNSGEALADIPPAIGEPAPLPPKPANYDTDPKAKFLWVSEVKQQQTNEKNFHSLRCDVNYKVETARAFLNLPMYFPHNMDFRGRAYPMPPTLNHLGNDLCRGLLHFDEAKPLGPRGWRWLKIHLANLYGYDKHSFTEREQYTMDNIEHILDSVDKPLEGKRWWLKAENPWQCLAACYEVAAAFRSGKPEEFKSQLPVHQDGTCNGLQHYAALGGDLAGARAVNLAAGDRPADVYTGVADMVNSTINKSAAEGDEMAKLLQGNISRKVVKQTVMTNVYGVTFVGARAQIENRLRENPNIPREKVYALSGYLAKVVFSSLGEMFAGARQIQDWLTDSARRIARSVPLETLQDAGIVPGGTNIEKTATGQKGKRSKKSKEFSARNPSASQMSSVIWTTPLGLPIVQPYRRSGKKQVATLLQTIFIEDPDASRPVNAMKQSTAFPPNFIHSLDATHMLLSAVACHKKGMTFASVHDSYWTHACDVDNMNEVIRDQFIELHSQPIMENLIAEFKERYKDYRVPHSALMSETSTTSAKKTIGGSEDDISDDGIGSSLFGDPLAMEKELEQEKFKKESEKKDALKAIFGLGGTPETDGDGDEDLEEEVEEEDASPKKKKGAAQKYKHSWEPLTFAPLPAKGEFDINEVKKSQYFFH